MTRVGDEAALVLDGRLEAREHVVQRHRQPGHLVSRRRHGQLARLARSHRLRAAAQHLDGTKRSRRERVAAERGCEQRQGQEDHELVAQVVERLAAGLERPRENRNSLARRRGLDEHTPLALVPGEPRVEPHLPAGRRLGEQLPAHERRRSRRLRVAQLPLRAEQLRERRAAARVRVDVAAANLLPGLPHERLVHGSEQLVGDAPVDEEPDDGEDDGHCRGEAERQADADRNPAHGSARSR